MAFTPQLEEIEEQAIELEATLHEQIDTNPELADYVRRLEQVYDQSRWPTARYEYRCNC